MSIRSALMLAGALALVGFGSAHAQESAMKQCADKWQAAKAANTTGGLTYLQFSSKCRADLKAEPAAAAPAAPAAPPLPPRPRRRPLRPSPRPPPSLPRPCRPPAAAGDVFPTAVSPTYKDQSPGKARMHTCLDQYNANKATGGNGGLKWIQKGGGYYSQCNATAERLISKSRPGAARRGSLHFTLRIPGQSL